MEVDDVEDDEVKGEEDDAVENDDVKQKEDDDVENDDVEQKEDDYEDLKELRRRTDPKTETHTLRAPAQGKCTWTFHKSHFVREFTDKMPSTSWSTLIKHRLLTFTLTARTPQRGQTVWGNNALYV